MDQATETYNDKSMHARALAKNAQGPPLPAANAAIPPATFDMLKADEEPVRLSAQYIINMQALENCPLDADESPFRPPYAATSDAISKARPMTLAGLASKARTAKREAFVQGGEENVCNGSALEWAWDLVNDLIRLDGGMA